MLVRRDHRLLARPLLGACVALLLGGCAGADAVPVDHGPAGRAVTEQGELVDVTFLLDCLGEDPVSRPATFVLSCADGNAALEGMTWSAWGEKVAHSQGVLACSAPAHPGVET